MNELVIRYLVFRRTFLILVLFCLQFFVAYGDVTPYPRPEGDAANPQYSVAVEGLPVESIATVMDVGYAHFAFDGKVQVKITASEPIETYDLSPHRLKIHATVEGNVLSFELDKPCKLHLRINNLKRFFLFADAPEKDAPQLGDENVFPLTDFGVVSSADVTQTEKIQQAIDAVAAKQGTLCVPPGIYLSGMLQLHGHMQLYLSPGAIIKGTARMEDYQGGRDGSAQFRLTERENVRIFGRGVLDNNGYTMRNQFLPDREPGRVRMFVMRKCQDVLVEDIILRDSGVWCFHMIESTDMQFRNLKIISISRSEAGPDTNHNTDAFDPDNSSNILMENNFISVDDDPIAIKLKGGQRRDMSNIIFRDNVIWTMCSALKIGTEVHDYTIRDVLFENNDVVHTDTGIVVQCYRGGYVDGVQWINNYFERVGVVANNSPHRKGADIYINSRSNDSFGEIRNLLIKDNTFERFSDLPSRIHAKGPTQVVDGVVFDNLMIAGKKRDSAEAARIKIDRDVRNVKFE
jgi:polygalacturonase